jgi:phytoene dehydrogenase-like protein
MDDAAHAAFKQRVERAIHGALHHTFPALAGAREHRALAATPRTWAKFTGRAHGRVGGLPFTFGTLARRYPSGLTRSPRLVRVGDTVFPGQSVVAVATGARRVARVLAERL